MSIYVRCPKERYEMYVTRPWSDVIHAAEGGEDGLSVKLPPMNRTNWNDNDEDYGYAYFYEGGHGWPKNKTLLYQQNW